MSERHAPGKSDNKGNANGQREDRSKFPPLEWRPSKLKERSLLHPHIVLHARRDSAGHQAFETLNEAKISFQLKLDLPDEKDVYVAWGEVEPNPQSMHFSDGDEGEIFEGLEGIKDYISISKDLTRSHKEFVLKRDPHAFDGGDPVYGEWVQSVKQELRDKNRALMYPEKVTSQN